MVNRAKTHQFEQQKQGGRIQSPFCLLLLFVWYNLSLTKDNYEEGQWHSFAFYNELRFLHSYFGVAEYFNSIGVRYTRSNTLTINVIIASTWKIAVVLV